MSDLSLLAQVATGNELSLNILERSLNFYQETGAAWDRIWDLVVNPTQPLWVAAIAIAKFIFGFSLLFYTYVVLSRLSNITTSKPVLDQMPLPLTVAFLFAGNGLMLSNLVLGIREIFQYFIVLALQIQIAGISVNQALQDIQSTAIANNRARVIFADCLSQTGLQLNDCVNDPVKIEQAQELLNGSGNILNGNALEAILNAVVSAGTTIIDGATAFIGSAVSTVLATPMIVFIQIILLVIQHAFINLVEATALLTAISAPIFLGFSLYTSNAPIFALWLTSFMGLYFIQLSYVFLIGFYGIVISQLDQAGVAVGTIVLDIAFLFYVALFAPIVAVGISLGGGVKLYEQIASNIERAATLIIATL
ncbi:hypothetical protein I4641_02460 [Waterburya agarophytonicola K14]|uniref:Uncharacterized protein n=1 Tax=Waterburya agarophytonicola KI4 TaxID=2874699 RepID=A0A964FFM9_9CYAN|nr:hypothetical protein [Waterburya agarophytonicola]MCC0175844.1 hypothetical protein [Waterburya agarophytonicola KI4]